MLSCYRIIELFFLSYDAYIGIVRNLYIILLIQLLTIADPARVAKSIDKNLNTAFQGISFIDHTF